jgi:hypothetical protein
MRAQIRTSTYIPLTLYPRRGSRGVSDIPSKRLRFTRMGNTADVTGGKHLVGQALRVHILKQYFFIVKYCRGVTH